MERPQAEPVAERPNARREDGHTDGSEEGSRHQMRCQTSPAKCRPLINNWICSSPVNGVWTHLRSQSGQNSCAGSDGPAENCLRGGGWLAFADEQAHEAALGNWAGREVPADADEPILSGHMVDVIVDEQSDAHVRVEQDGH